METYLERAKEWVDEVYAPIDARLAGQVIEKSMEVDKQCLKLLCCFTGAGCLNHVLTEYEEAFYGDMDDTEQFYDIYALGLYDVKDKRLSPDWFVVPLPMHQFSVTFCAYFPSFRKAVEYIAQMALHQHIKGVLEYGDTDSDWQTIFEGQLASAWVAVRWHELGGSLQPALTAVMSCFPNLEISGFQKLDSFILNTLLAEDSEISLLSEYIQFFRQSPSADSLKRIECWEWVNRRLPDEF